MKYYAFRYNESEVEFPEDWEVVNFEDLMDIQSIDQFVSKVQNTIVDWNKYDYDVDKTLVIVDNQALVNSMYEILNYKDDKSLHIVTIEQCKLLGGIINNFSGNVIIHKLARDWSGKCVVKEYVKCINDCL